MILRLPGAALLLRVAWIDRRISGTQHPSQSFEISTLYGSEHTLFSRHGGSGLRRSKELSLPTTSGEKMHLNNPTKDSMTLRTGRPGCQSGGFSRQREKKLYVSKGLQLMPDIRIF